MLDIDPGKLLIIGIVALVVIPPKDLPRVMRQIGQAVGKLRRMAAEFQSQFMDAVREAELDEIRKTVSTVADTAKMKVDFDPVKTVRDEITGALGEGKIGTAPPAPNTSGETAGPSSEAAFPAAVETAADIDAAAAGVAPLVPVEGEKVAVDLPLQSEMPAAVPVETATATPGTGATRP